MQPKYTNEFEFIDTPEKAYVLGFFYSDGWISAQQAGISIIDSDKSVLEKINSIFPFLHFRNKEKNKNIATILCNYKKFREDIEKNGCLRKKSSLNKDNLKFPKISKDLYRHFIRGIFDGDGSIFYVKRKGRVFRGERRVTITGNCHLLLRQIKYILYLNGINFKIQFIKNPPNSKIREKVIEWKQPCYFITCSNIKGVEDTYKYFYNDTDLYLQRKFNVFNDKTHLNYTLEKEKNKIPCRYCNSLRTNFMNKKKNYYECRACKKYFKFKKDQLLINAPNSSDIISG